jgi:hypothetical protein
MTDDDDPLAGFDPDAALEEMRELAGSEDNANEVVKLFRRLDDHLCGGCGALPQDWQPDPGVIAERSFRNQPRRTSRKERR